MSKNVAVFVDVANIFYAAKAAGADIDYVTLLKAAVAGRDFVRAYAYTGLDPENENQRNFHQFLARHGYKVVSKDIRKYGDGKVKANLDIELVVDMMKTARNLDVAIVVSGDGDFAPAIRAVQEMGVRVEVISFRGNTSSDLIDAADAFYDITTMARVDRDSSKSGRRVADDEEDLSMTEVPDKQTEGRSGRRGRGRGRVEEPAGRSRRGRTAITALPGEKLSKAAADGQPADGEALVEEPEGAVAGEEQLEGDQAGRRRRRRGGRGRGHGRGHDELVEADAELGPEEAGTSSAPRSNQFGSVWDSQIGMAGRPERLAPISSDEDDFAEPEIPEYLLAERRAKGGGGRGRGGQGGRGMRSAYASAVERERYGRSSLSRYPEPARGGGGGGQQPRRRDEQPRRRQPQPQQRGGQRGGNSAEPWSEVPPEIEELLRAQLSSKVSRPASEPSEAAESAGAAPDVATQPKSTRGRRKPAASETAGEGAEATAETAASTNGQAPSRARGRRKAAEGEAGGMAEAGTEAAEAAPKKRTVRRKTSAAAEAAGEAMASGEAGEPSGE